MSENVLDLKPSGQVYPGEFLRVVTGSTLLGLNVDPNGDRDETGIFIESPEYITGLKRIEQYSWRSQPEGTRSVAGDSDVVVYGLQKWMRLALKGNPNIHLVLFAPRDYRIIDQILADDLRAQAPAILSRRSCGAYLGYLTAQRQRLLGERGGRRVSRSLNDHGYDGKYACHMVRLGFQGVELMTTGRLLLPLPEPARSYCVAVRRGELELEDVLAKTKELEGQLSRLKLTSELPAEPDCKAINEFLHDAYAYAWKSH